MTFLTAEFRLIKSFWAFGVTFTGCELPAGWTGHALVLPGSTATLAAHVAFLANAAVTVVTLFASS